MSDDLPAEAVPSRLRPEASVDYAGVKGLVPVSYWVSEWKSKLWAEVHYGVRWQTHAIPCMIVGRPDESTSHWTVTTLAHTSPLGVLKDAVEEETPFSNESVALYFNLPEHSNGCSLKIACGDGVPTLSNETICSHEGCSLKTCLDCASLVIVPPAPWCWEHLPKHDPVADLKEDDLMKLAEVRGISTDGTKDEVAERIMSKLQSDLARKYPVTVFAGEDFGLDAVKSALKSQLAALNNDIEWAQTLGSLAVWQVLKTLFTTGTQKSGFADIDEEAKLLLITAAWSTVRVSDQGRSAMKLWEAESKDPSSTRSYPRLSHAVKKALLACLMGIMQHHGVDKD